MNNRNKSKNTLAEETLNAVEVLGVRFLCAVSQLSLEFVLTLRPPCTTLTRVTWRLWVCLPVLIHFPCSASHRPLPLIPLQLLPLSYAPNPVLPAGPEQSISWDFAVTEGHFPIIPPSGLNPLSETA